MAKGPTAPLQYVCNYKPGIPISSFAPPQVGPVRALYIGHQVSTDSGKGPATGEQVELASVIPAGVFVKFSGGYFGPVDERTDLVPWKGWEWKPR